MLLTSDAGVGPWQFLSVEVDDQTGAITRAGTEEGGEIEAKHWPDLQSWASERWEQEHNPQD